MCCLFVFYISIDLRCYERKKLYGIRDISSLPSYTRRVASRADSPYLVDKIEVKLKCKPRRKCFALLVINPARHSPIAFAYWSERRTRKRITFFSTPLFNFLFHFRSSLYVYTYMCIYTIYIYIYAYKIHI